MILQPAFLQGSLGFEFPCGNRAKIIGFGVVYKEGSHEPIPAVEVQHENVKGNFLDDGEFPSGAIVSMERINKGDFKIVR